MFTVMGKHKGVDTTWVDSTRIVSYNPGDPVAYGLGENAGGLH